MSNHLKSKNNRPSSHTDTNHGDDGQRDIRGSVHVRGEIEANVPPAFIEQYKAASEHAKARDDEDSIRDTKRFRLEIITLIVVSVYAALTFWQGCSNQKLVDIAQKTFKASNRPYIGPQTITMIFGIMQPDGSIKRQTAKTEESNVFIVEVVLKNYGTIPADRYSAAIEARIRGELMTAPLLETGNNTVYPSQAMMLTFYVPGEAYQDVISGKEQLLFNVSYSYDGLNTGHYEECERYEYKKTFFNEGSRCKEPWTTRFH